MQYAIVDHSPIVLGDLRIEVSDLLRAVELTNRKFQEIYQRTCDMHLDVFDVLDFRVLSGVIGETFSTELARLIPGLEKNPNIDGYPDLLRVDKPEMRKHFDECIERDFLLYRYGGLEVKNTFGQKKSGTMLLQGEQRIKLINKKLDWKAHHRDTNNLVGLFTDYIAHCPRIAALCYSDRLVPDDWQVKQQPSETSAMTSFSAINASGFKKMKQGTVICLADRSYSCFFAD